MSKNIDQVFVANPASSMLTSDLYYLGRAPYGVGNDMAILWSDVLASIASQASGTWGINITGNAGTVTTNANLTGDVTSSGNATTLATVNSNVGSFGDGTHVGQFTVNAKGLITAASSVAITGAVPTGSAGGDLSGSYPNPSVIKTGGIAFAPSATIDTTNASNITSGVLPLTRLGTTYTDGQILIGSTSTGFLSAATLTAGTNITITNAGASITIAASGGGGGVTSTQVQQQVFNYALDTGTANAYAVALSPAVTSYTDGLLVFFTASNSNTGASTISVNGLSAVPILSSALAALASGAIVATGSYEFIYNAGLSSFVAINSSVSSGGGANFPINTDITSMTGLTGYLKHPAGVMDSSGNLVLQFGVGGAVAGWIQVGVTSAGPYIFGDVAPGSGIPLVLYHNGSQVVIQDKAGADPSSLYIYNAGNTQFTGFTVAGSQSTSVLFTLPAVDGTNGQVLTTNGSGVLSFQTASGGSGPWSAGAGTDSAIGGDGSATATGPYSLSYGDSSCTASGNNSFSLGTGCQASGNRSFAMGNTCIASGNTSFAFGFACTTGFFDSGAFSFGSNCQANGNFAFAFGEGCQAQSNNTFAFGVSAIAINQGSLVWGDSNSSPNSDSAQNQWNTTFAGGYSWFLTNAPLLAAQIDSLGNFTNALGIADISKIILTPTTSSTITLATTNFRTILNPSGTLLTLTINMPPSPVDGQLQKVTTTQAVTTLTVSGNGNSIIGAPTSLIVGQVFSMIYDIGTTTWYPA